MSTAVAITSLVEELRQKSEDLFEHLRAAAGQTEYEDAFIEKIQQLIGSRQVTIDELQNEAERQKTDLKTLIDAQIPKEDCARLISLEKEITPALRRIFANIQHSRKLLHDKQRSRRQYRNPFASVERDGMFVDKRK